MTMNTAQVATSALETVLGHDDLEVKTSGDLVKMLAVCAGKAAVTFVVVLPVGLTPLAILL